MSGAETGPITSKGENNLNSLFFIQISTITTFSLAAVQMSADLKEVSQRFHETDQAASAFLWEGYYFKESTLCTSPNDGRDCSADFQDRLKIEKNPEGYLVALHSTQANQNICSFSFTMELIDGGLVHNTKLGPILLQADSNLLKLSSKGIDPTALGIGVCGIHANIDKLTFPLSSKRTDN